MLFAGRLYYRWELTSTGACIRCQNTGVAKPANLRLCAGNQPESDELFFVGVMLMDVCWFEIEFSELNHCRFYFFCHCKEQGLN